MRKSNGLEKILIPNDHVAFYKTEEEALRQISFFLENEEQRKKIEISGYTFIQQYTFKNLAQKILDGNEHC